MKTIEISESALDSLRAMVQRLQDERDELLQAAQKLIDRADWKVGGALSPTSKRSDFQSNGISYVMTRDLAELRDVIRSSK